MHLIRPAEARGRTRTDWLDSRHSFSFGQYLDPEHMGFGPLRVINEDKVAPGAGFGAHGHANMEILSVVISGALAHRDSLGREAVIRPGDVQRMSAGTGVRHSEFNASTDEPVHFLQIWIVPERDGLAPSYAERTVPREARRGRLALLASRDPGEGGGVTLHRDVDLYGGVLAPDQQVQHIVAGGRGIWVQMIAGALSVQSSGETGAATAQTVLGAGDGLALTEVQAVSLTGRSAEAELLLFDLAL